MDYNDNKEYKQALKYFKKSADKGNPAAFLEIGSMYATEEGVEKDYKKALGLYMKSSEQGNVESKKFIEDMFAKGEVKLKVLKKLINY